MFNLCKRNSMDLFLKRITMPSLVDLDPMENVFGKLQGHLVVVFGVAFVEEWLPPLEDERFLFFDPWIVRERVFKHVM